MKHVKIMGRIVLLFSIVILMSFVPESNREFFGDWQCQGMTYVKASGEYLGCYYEGSMAPHDPTWHWGFRHWIWMLMGLTLFIYNTVVIVITLDKEYDKR